jgi:tryptophan-rich hypothetical protein
MVRKRLGIFPGRLRLKSSGLRRRVLNKVSPKALLQSKWTKTKVTNKEKHFVITDVEFDEDQRVVECVIEAVMNNHQYSIDWRDLKNKEEWRMGWL